MKKENNYRPRFVKGRHFVKDLAHPNSIIGNDKLVEIVENYRELLFLLLGDVELFEIVDKKIW